MEVPQKLKTELSYDLAVPLLGIYLERKENATLKRYMLPNVHRLIIYNSQDMESTSVSINRLMDNGILPSHKKESNSTTGSDMDGSGGYYA